MRPATSAWFLFFVLGSASLCMAAGRAMTVDDLLAVKGVSDPQASPDGKFIAYVVSEIDKAANKSNSDIWVVPTSGGTPRKLTNSPGADNHPRWSPDSTQIAFLSTRSGSAQVWLLPFAEGGEAKQVTKLPIDVANGPLWSPKGDAFAISAEVYPGMTPEQTAERDKEKETSKTKVRIYDSLMIRHWAAWDEGKRGHLFTVDLATGAAKDLTPKFTSNIPPGPFGDSSDFAWSPDGKSLAFTAEPQTKDFAWSTNKDVWIVPAEGGEARNMTEKNQGADERPSFSPDGKVLAWLSQARPGFEADLVVLKIRDLQTGVTQDLSSDLDRPVQAYAWGAVRKVEQPFKGIVRDIYAVIDDQGTEPIVTLGFLEADSDGTYFLRERTKVVTGGVNTAVQALPDGKGLVFLKADSSRPAELYTSAPDGTRQTALSSHNAPLLSQLDVNRAEGFTFKGADGDEVSGWLVKPPGFDPKKKYPVLFLIHGGPQGAWHDEWHGRWNYGLFAAPGYVAVAINPRGSTGYGQKFTDQISKDWTGRVYVDLMNGLDHALKTYPFLDGDRVGALGGSYGGFMVNWIAGHSDRFKALISHAGVFDLGSKYGTTEELWFPEWEFGGPPWEKPELYASQSPSKFVDKFKTPTLVIHGALDFRVPDAQGLGMFTSLQRKGVPSRYVWFPDEGHWILKPQNRIVWWREVHEWLAYYLKK